MLHLKDITVRFNKRLILDNISFSLEEGEILTIVGPSGSGKSTLLNVIGGIINEYSGQITYKDQQIRNFVKGYIPQNLGLLPWKTVHDNIFLAQKVNPNIEITDEEAHEIISELGISDLLYRYPTEISGGQRQRVALARLFVSLPDLLLMDEAFSALDTFTAEVSRDLFLSLWKKRKITTVCTTHNLIEAVKLGKKILVLGENPGRILHIFENPLFEKGAKRTAENYFNFAGKIETFMKENLKNID